MSIDEIKRELMDANPEALYAEGLDDALIGYTINTYANHVAVYSASQCVKVIMKQGLNELEAEEYLEFNTYCAYMGPNSPIYIRV